MTMTYVFDGSALAALLDSEPTAYRLWESSRAGEVHVVMPATAIAVATGVTKADFNAWNPLLWNEGVQTLSLDAGTAIEIGPWPGDLSARHVIYETHAVGGVAVTREPEMYQPGAVPLLILLP
jgi:hypothetical protein